MDANSKVALYRKFTDTYQQWADNHARREIECMRVQYPLWLEPVEKGDLCAGRGEFDKEIGFTPQALINKFGYYIDYEKASALLGNPSLTEENKEIFKTIIEFWKEEETVRQLRSRYPLGMSRELPSDNWQGESGEAFPLYRMSGTQVDYDKLMHLGLPGLRKEILGYQKEGAFYQDIISALDYVEEVMHWYASGLKESDDVNFQEIAEILEALCVRAPRTLREAIQLSYLYCQLAGSLNFGRMDVYLGDFLAEDLADGRLTEESAIEMIGAYWRLIEKRMRVYDSRLTLGGAGRRNVENADRFTLYALKAVQRERCVAPQITLRFSADGDCGFGSRIMDAAVDAIGDGCTFPMLYNDDVNIPSVMKAFGVSREVAEEYIPFGCGEFTLYHRSVGTPSGVINLMQILLETLKKEIYSDYDALWRAFADRVGVLASVLAEQEMLEYRFAGETAPFLLLSALYDGCLEKGLPIFSGGVQYLGGTLESYGGTNAADSLVAIRELVFDRHLLSQQELLDILETDFEGEDVLRSRCLNLPKFGNDDNIADDVKVAVDRCVCLAAREGGKAAGLDSYLVVFINNDANTILGHYTGASPDGRHAGQPLANGNAPSGGNDRNGVTALLNSMTKPATDIHAGAVQNIKFSKEMFTIYRNSTEAIIRAYFLSGGSQLMVTVVDRGELEKAMECPEKYRGLIVRVGGFSAHFVELGRDVQLEILSRTLY